MQDHGNQQKYLNKYINILGKLMNKSCKIDARKSNAKNIENDANLEPKWNSSSINNTRKNDTKKHHEQLCKNEAPERHTPGGALGQECWKR